VVVARGLESVSVLTLSITDCRYDEMHVCAPNIGSLKIDHFVRVYPSAVADLAVGRVGLKPPLPPQNP
jgi:hypothetical protein